MTTKAETQAKSPKEPTREDFLVEELSRYYGVQLGDDKDEFIRQCTKTAREQSKGETVIDPIKAAKHDEMVGELNRLWADTEGDKSETQAQKDLRKELKDQGVKVSVDFPDDHTWHVSQSGREDSGPMDMGTQAIVGLATKVASPEQLT